MQIFVKDFKGRTITIQVEPTDLIEDLRFKIEYKEGIPPDAQRLVFQGKLLEENYSIQDYSIQKDSVIRLVGRLFGG